MAQERSPNPEKQLLGLIEGHRGKEAGSHAGAIKQHRSGLFFPDAWGGRVSFLKDSIEKWFKSEGRNIFEVKAVNSLLTFVIFILVVYLMSDLTVSVINMKKIPDYLKPGAQKERGAVADIYDTSGLSRGTAYYLEKVRQRNIFRMGSEVTSGTETVAKAPTAEIIQATQHLKLVGISWSADPDALIEDTKASRTFFVKRSQMVGEIKIQAIFKDKVILSFKGEEIELK